MPPIKTKHPRPTIGGKRLRTHDNSNNLLLLIEDSDDAIEQSSSEYDQQDMPASQLKKLSKKAEEKAKQKYISTMGYQHATYYPDRSSSSLLPQQSNETE